MTQKMHFINNKSLSMNIHTQIYLKSPSGIYVLITQDCCLFLPLYLKNIAISLLSHVLNYLNLQKKEILFCIIL